MEDEFVRIRIANPGDAAGIAKVHVDAWRTTYNGILPQEFLNRLDYGNRTNLWIENLKTDTIFVAVNTKEEIIGFATGGHKKSQGYNDFQGELYAIYILEEFQGMAIGKKLLNRIVEYLKTLQINSMLVLVLKENPAVQFYHAMGAQKIDSITITIAGEKVQEEVYGWNNLEILHK